jgi:hypothetical protein
LERLKTVEHDLTAEREKNQNLSRENADLFNRLKKYDNLSIKHVELVRKVEDFSTQNTELVSMLKTFFFGTKGWSV